MSGGRNDGLRREIEYLAGHVRHLPGATLLGAAVVEELVSWIDLVQSELIKDRSQGLSAKLQAWHVVLTTGCHRADAKKRADDTVDALNFEHEFEVSTAAGLLDMKRDTMRSKLRAGTIRGRKVGQQWMVPLSEIEKHTGKVA